MIIGGKPCRLCPEPRLVRRERPSTRQSTAEFALSRCGASVSLAMLPSESELSPVVDVLAVSERRSDMPVAASRNRTPSSDSASRISVAARWKVSVSLGGRSEPVSGSWPGGALFCFLLRAARGCCRDADEFQSSSMEGYSGALLSAHCDPWYGSCSACSRFRSSTPATAISRSVL